MSQMREKAESAKQARKVDLPEKYLACDPLPDPYNERDITTFITLWKESTDKTLQECNDQC